MTALRDEAGDPAAPGGSIVVTGASRSIGAAIACELARRGFLVGCFSRGGRIPQEAGAFAERMIPIPCDVTDEPGVVSGLKRFADLTGGVGGLVNNAGIHSSAPSRKVTSAEFERMLKVNTVSTFTFCREVYPYLVAQGGGLIVNIGSFFARGGARGSTAYSASKAAIGAITRCLAAEWGPKNIRLLNVAPGYVETDVNRDYLKDPARGGRVRERIFINRPGQPQEVAQLVAALFAERIAFLTGETIYIDGGHSIAI